MGFFTHQHSTTSISTAFARIGPYKQSSASFSHSQIRHIKPYIVYPTRDEFRIPSTVLFAMPSSEMPLSLIPASNQWSNIAALSFAASLAQLLGKTTTIGRLLGAPIVAMALTFGLSSLNIVPPINSASSWLTLLPSGGSPASTLLQTISLTLATPLLLLGTSLRGKALQKCSSLLGSFLIASLGTLIGAMVAVMIPSLFSILPSMMHASLPNGDGIKIAAALLAKNIGGGINYMAVCSCLGAAPESVAAGLCVDNVMSLLYFPLTSVLASKYDDTDDGATEVGSDAQQDETIQTESLSHALTIAVVLTALGQHLNSMQPNSSLNLSLPITTLLTVLFSTYYPSNWFLSPTSTKFLQTNNAGNSKGIAKAGEYLGNSLLYLFFASVGAPGWRLKDSIRQSFPSIAIFLIIMYGIHLGVLWGFRRIVISCTRQDTTNTSFWMKVVAPQRLLTGSSAAIGGPATAAALAQANDWASLRTPSLLVGNVGYAVATFVALMFYSTFR